MQKGTGGLRMLVVTLIALIVGFTLVLRFAYGSREPGQELSLDQLFELTERGQIMEATLLDQDAQIQGKLCPVSVSPTPPRSCAGELGEFHASYPASDVGTQQLIQNLSARGTKVVVDKQTDKAIAKLLISFIFPLAMLANLFGIIFMWRGGESSLAEIAGFGTIRRRRGDQGDTSQVGFADVAGQDEAVAEMREVTEYLKDPDRFEVFGAAPPKGVLLFGPPGCGKTLLARATAGESNVPFFSVSGTEFVESLVGIGAARIRDLFSQVREVAPAIVFIDEIDAVGRRRSGEGTSGGEREQTLNQLLVEMDGFEVTAGVVLMGATNRPDILDPALMRPGRFDRHVTLIPPDLQGREAILKLHAASRPVAPDVDFALLARRTPGFTGADLANVINEAVLLAIRDQGGATEPGDDGQSPTLTIHMDHLSEAVQRVVHGPQRRGQILNADERRRLAFHESAHALVSTALGHHQSVHRLSIVARGRGVAQAAVGADTERVLLTAEEMQASLAASMAGIAAEVLVFGSSSTTAEDDIDQAHAMAREMVGLYGMSEEVGRLRLLGRQQGFLAMDGRPVEAMAATTMAQFDLEVKRLIRAAEQLATAVLEENRTTLDAMAARLEEDETLEGSPLEELLRDVRRRTIGHRANGAARAPARKASTSPGKRKG